MRAIVTEKSLEALRNLPDGARVEVSVVEWRARPALKLSHDGQTLGYTPKDRFTADLIQLAKRSNLQGTAKGGFVRLDLCDQEAEGLSF